MSDTDMTGQQAAVVEHVRNSLEGHDDRVAGDEVTGADGRLRARSP